MKITPQQLKSAGISIDALATAERKIAKYERAFRRIDEYIDGAKTFIDPTELVGKMLDEIRRVYPAKQRKGKR